MLVTPATVVLLTLAFTTLVAIGFAPFVVERDSHLRSIVLFGIILALALFAMSAAAFGDDNTHKAEKLCP